MLKALTALLQFMSTRLSRSLQVELPQHVPPLEMGSSSHQSTRPSSSPLHVPVMPLGVQAPSLNKTVQSLQWAPWVYSRTVVEGFKINQYNTKHLDCKSPREEEKKITGEGGQEGGRAVGRDQIIKWKWAVQMDLIKKVTCEQRLQELREYVKYIWEEGERTPGRRSSCQKRPRQEWAWYIRVSTELEVRGSRRGWQRTKSQLSVAAK